MTISAWFSIIMGALVALIGLINPLLMGEVLGRPNGSETLRGLHRWLGRLFVLGFLAFFVYMAPRAAYLSNFPVYEAMHAILGFTLLPLILAKYLASVRYKKYMNSLGTLGLTIAALVFTLICLSSGHILMEILFKA